MHLQQRATEVHGQPNYRRPAAVSHGTLYWDVKTPYQRRRSPYSEAYLKAGTSLEDLDQSSLHLRLTNELTLDSEGMRNRLLGVPWR